MEQCRCHIDWRALRKAMGLTQAELAALLGVHRTQVIRWEARSRLHQCPRKSVLILLRIVLSTPEMQAWLTQVPERQKALEGIDGVA